MLKSGFLQICAAAMCSKATVYIRTVSSYRMLSVLLNWFMGRLDKATCTLHSIFAQTSQDESNVSKLENS